MSAEEWTAAARSLWAKTQIRMRISAHTDAAVHGLCHIAGVTGASGDKNQAIAQRSLAQ